MRNAIRFLLGDQPVEISDVDPTETVLNWLRYKIGRTGTKEGCAEGDCGACTVVIARPDGNGGLDHRAVNSCIQFMPTLDGCQILTVEDLELRNGEYGLHPVQQAMVEHHGSQCGFCTPGFVMSLFAATRGEARDREGLKRAVAGNLCRCTGYGPILDAGEAIMSAPVSDRFTDAESKTAERLSAMSEDGMLAFESLGKRYFAPEDLEEFDALIAQHPDARIIAGLTDVGLWVTKQGREIETIVSLNRVRELKSIGNSDGVLQISAGVTLAEAEAHLSEISPDIAEMLRRFASEQIRNAGTVCGNIANGSPIGDLPPVLIALGAKIVLRRQGKHRTMLLEDFFIEYGKQHRAAGELVEAVRIPALSGNVKFGCYKISKRFEQDISAVMAAFAVKMEDGKVLEACLAYGGMAGIPKRATAAERALVGHPLDEEAVERAMDALGEDFTPLDDMRASADYRITVARNLILKFFHEVTVNTSETRIVEAAHG